MCSSDLLIFSAVTVWSGALFIRQIADKNKIYRKTSDLTKEEKRISKKKCQRKQKIYLFIIIAFNLSLLFIVKYFFPVFSHPIALPLGISFYSLQAISYLVDVYGEKYEPQHNFGKILLYLCWFPQLIQGPINRYDLIETDLFKTYRINAHDFRYAFYIFMFGAVKKYAIGDLLAPIVNSALNDNSGSFPGSYLLFGAILFAIEQYADFSGGIDMAMGASLLFGVKLNNNFRQPYFSSSLAEFWRRWHISLGRWFREYLYIPLGGNRKGMTRTLLNLFIVFAATGIWHGASWNFLIWGLWHALFIIIERIGFGKVLEKHKFFGHVYSVVVVMLGFVIFRIEDLSYLTGYLRIMFDPVNNFAGGYSVFEFMGNKTLIAFAAAVIAAGAYRLLIEQSRAGGVFTALKFRPAEEVYCFLLLSLSILQLISGTYNPFIYYRF